MNIDTIFKAQTEKNIYIQGKNNNSLPHKLLKFWQSKDVQTIIILYTQNFRWYNICTLSKDHSRSTMPTIPYLRSETFKNYTILGDTYLSSPCILIKVTILMFCRSWFGAEKSAIQISWFLDLLWEVKMCFLRNDVFHCISIRLHGNIFYHYFITLRHVIWHNYLQNIIFCANVAAFQWTLAFCNKGNFWIQDKL